MSLGDRIDALFSEYTGAVPGASFAVVKDDELISRSYGLAEVSTGTLVKSSTNFRLASVTKAFTAICVLKLVEGGKMGLEDKLSAFIPNLPGYADDITVRQMLGHTSGLGDYENDVPVNYPGQVHEDYVVEKVRSLPSTYFPPGSKFQYSDTAYVLLAVIVERVSGVPFPRYVEREIFKPLGMTGSRLYEGEGVKIKDRAYGYTRSASVFRFNDQSKTSATLGDGCVYSSIQDLMKWDRALNSDELVDKDLLEAAFTAGRLTDGSPTEYGFGWFIAKRGGVKILHHTGETAGFQHKFIRVPEKKLALIILTNRDSYDLALPKQLTEAEDSISLLEYFDLV
ncbi:MAG: serine hydrolase domain-containing protein [Candidatus Bathyarchaeia archaeon]|jgi:CubicO group peptidase (beta-lactamase class C family)